MSIAKYLAAAAALSMATAPAVAAANPASSLSISTHTRASTTAHQKSDLAGMGGAYIAVLGLFIALAAIYVVVDNDDDPRSP